MSEEKKRAVDKAYAEQLTHLVDEFREKIRAGTRNAEDFLTISEIERLWSELRGNTSIIYSDMLQELLSSADESDLIRKKKTNTEPKA